MGISLRYICFPMELVLIIINMNIIIIIVEISGVFLEDSAPLGFFGASQNISGLLDLN